MNYDTDIGGRGDAFPATQPSAVIAAASDDAGVRQNALETIVAGYWKPVYKYVRVKWRAPNEEAKDLTQAFFADVMERNLLINYDAARGAFRTYLRTCLDGFVSNARKAGSRLKRGGGRQTFSLDFDAAEGEFGQSAAGGVRDPNAYFDREWVRNLFGLAVDALRVKCDTSNRSVSFALFNLYDLRGGDGQDRLTYEALARQFDMPVTQVTNHLAWARRTFRALVTDRLRAMTGSDEEFRDEARALFGEAAE